MSDHFAPPRSAHEQITLAFHFQYIMRGEYVSDTAVAVLLLERMLLALRPIAAGIGSVVIRMEKLFYTQHLGGTLEGGWRESLQQSRLSLNSKLETWSGKTRVPLDRIFVVVISGRLDERLEALSRRFSRYRRYPYLWGMQVASDNHYQEAIYLSQSTPIGILHPDFTLEFAFGCIEYEPDFVKMLGRLGIENTISDAALREVLRLIDEDEG